MLYNHEILKNRFFTGETNSAVNSDLHYKDKYYTNLTTIDQNVVDSFNVRGFLSNEKNQKVVKLYYSFLTASPLMNSALLIDALSTDFTPTAYFKEIYYDDVKLSNSFNDFYNLSILRGNSSDITQNPNVFNVSVRNNLISEEQVETVLQETHHNFFLWESPGSNISAYSPKNTSIENSVLGVYSGKRSSLKEEKVVTIPLNKNFYFINVFLNKSNTQLSRMSFDVCEDIIYKSTGWGETFSQNLNDKINSQDFFIHSGDIKIKSFDNTTISTDKNYSNVYSSDSEKRNLLQCFVDPNFNTNQNEYWSDSFINTVSFKDSNYSININEEIDVLVQLLKPAQQTMSVELICIDKTTNGSEYEFLSPYENLNTIKVVELIFHVGDFEKVVKIKNITQICSINNPTGTTGVDLNYTGITIGTSIPENPNTIVPQGTFIPSMNDSFNTVVQQTAEKNNINIGVQQISETLPVSITTQIPQISTENEWVVIGSQNSSGSTIPVFSSTINQNINTNKQKVLSLELSNPSIYLQTTSLSVAKIIIKTCN